MTNDDFVHKGEFSMVLDQINKLDGKMDTVQEGVSKLNTSVATINTKLDTVVNRQDKTENRLDFVENSHNELKTKVAVIQKTININDNPDANESSLSFKRKVWNSITTPSTAHLVIIFILLAYIICDKIGWSVIASLI